MTTTRTPLVTLDAALSPLARETETLDPFALGGAGESTPEEPGIEADSRRRLRRQFRHLP